METTKMEENPNLSHHRNLLHSTAGVHIDWDADFVTAMSELELEKIASTMRTEYKLKGVLHVNVGEGEFPSEYECIDAIHYLHKPWHIPGFGTGSYLHGLSENCSVHFADIARGPNNTFPKRGYVSLVFGKKYVVHLRNVVASAVHDSCFAIMVKHNGLNALCKTRLEKQHGFICYVFDAQTEEDATALIIELKRLVTHQALERAALSHAEDGSLTTATFSHGFDTATYGLDAVPAEPLEPAPNTQPWFKGQLSPEQCNKFHAGEGLDVKVEQGDFYIRESSSANAYTLTVIADPSDGSVVHFRIHVEEVTGLVFLEGKEESKFKTLRALIQYYDHKGLGIIKDKTITLIKALGTSDPNTLLKAKLKKMNQLMQRGMDF